MKVYALHAYNFDESILTCVSEDEDFIIQKAIEGSSDGNYACRLETWEDGKRIGCRFFERGEEFTPMLRESLLDVLRAEISD
jgi:hypothetical protein